MRAEKGPDDMAGQAATIRIKLEEMLLKLKEGPAQNRRRRRWHDRLTGEQIRG